MANLALLKPEQLTEIAATIPKSDTPLWKYWDEFQQRYLESGRSEVTISNTRDALRFVIRQLKLISIEDVNNSRLLENSLFAYKKDHQITSTTYNTYLKNINTYFIWLERQDYIAKNNLVKIMRCKNEINEQYTLSEEQVNLIVGNTCTRRQTKLERARNTLFVLLLRFTGARPCEMLNIRYQDISKQRETYKIIIKGRKQKGRPRYYEFDSSLRDAYEIYIQHRNQIRPNENMLFVSCSKPGGWTQKGMRGLFRQLSKEVGFKVTAYGFRRYVATRLNTKGAELKDIQNYLGHSRYTTTQRYIEQSCSLTSRGSALMALANTI